MNRKPFHFKQFSIYHDKCAMKVGTDGVLLGAWVPVNHPRSILDIGTGTGVIAIMLAQRTSGNTKIDAIDIDQSAHLQALENINNSPWTHQISVHHTSLQNFDSQHQYDLIVSNPPYFQKGSKPIDTSRDIARHTKELPFSELISSSYNLLAPKGSLNVILPLNEGVQFVEMAKNKGLHCNHLVEVVPKLGKSIERLLLSFSRNPLPLHKGKLIIQYEKRNHYTPEYVELTKDFYTIM